MPQSRLWRCRASEAVDVNLQRGFVSVRTEGRILLTPGPAPEGLYSVEWSSGATLAQGRA